jgi:hypothetical protein
MKVFNNGIAQIGPSDRALGSAFSYLFEPVATARPPLAKAA